jgi:hypothetical protein
VSLSNPKPHEVIIPEAKGKRVEELAVTEPYANWDEVYLTIRFDDGTEISFDVSARIRFGFTYMRLVDGEQVPIRQQAQGFLREIDSGKGE